MAEEKIDRSGRRGFLEKSGKGLLGAGLLASATATSPAAPPKDVPAKVGTANEWVPCNGYPAIPYPCPVEPTFGKCRTFFLEHLRKGGHFDAKDFSVRVPALAELHQQAFEVFDALDLTPEQAALARQFDFGPATLQFEHFVREYLYIPYGFSPPRVARIQVYLNAAMADGFTVTWDLKYQHMLPRPVQLRPELRTLVQTPGHPTWPSGHSTVAGAADAILSYFFPAQQKLIHDFAENCAYARQLGGVHYPADDNDGLTIGRVIGNIAAQRAASDGYDDLAGLRQRPPASI
ncbi:MAG: phosphatase PAP2 family protein [Acidobacteriota bacterium]